MSVKNAGVPVVANIWISQVNASDNGMEKGLEWQTGVSFATDLGVKTSNTIVVDETKTYQTVDGFGASITEASAHLYQTSLSADDKAAMFQSLFGKENGIAISMLRQTIGACDHCIAPYNFAPNPQAENLPDWDFSHELLEIYPTLIDALAIEKGRVSIIASSWSPPGWMKANGSELGMYNNIRGTLLPDMYQAYANYLAKFVQAYESRGIHILGITVTNESDFACCEWPAMPMSVEEQQELVKNYIAPALRLNGLDTKILCWDHNYSTPNYPDGQFPRQYFKDADAASKTAGIAWHWYEGAVETISLIKQEYPDKQHWFTEGSGGEWQFPKWRAAFLNQSSCIINILRNWCQSVIYWNLALDQNGGPDYYYDVNRGEDATNRGIVTIDTNTSSWFPNVDYYTLGHVSKFVDPGAVRIESTSFDGNIETVAFKNPDGTKILVLGNLSPDSQAVKILWGDQSIEYTVPAEAMMTVTWG